MIGWNFLKTRNTFLMLDHPQARFRCLRESLTSEEIEVRMVRQWLDLCEVGEVFCNPDFSILYMVWYMYKYKIYIYIDMASWLIASIPILGYPHLGTPSWSQPEMVSILRKGWPVEPPWKQKSVVWRCIVWYLKKSITPPKFKKFALEKWW